MAKGKVIGAECYVHDSQKSTDIMAKQVIIFCSSLRISSMLTSSELSNNNIEKYYVGRVEFDQASASPVYNYTRSKHGEKSFYNVY